MRITCDRIYKNPFKALASLLLIVTYKNVEQSSSTPSFEHESRFLLRITHTSKLHFKIGTGLAIIRRIVEACGGRICVETEGADKGSCFCFTLAYVITDEFVICRIADLIA